MPKLKKHRPIQDANLVNRKVESALPVTSGIRLPHDGGLARHKRLEAKRKRSGKVIHQSSGTERIGMGRDKRETGMDYHGQRWQKPGRFKK